MKTCIEIQHANIGYQKAGEILPVLSHLNLHFLEGDFVGVVGLNGSGKSTLLKSLCGLLPILSGQLKIDQEPIQQYTLSSLAKKISIVLTEKINGFNLRVSDVVAAGQMPYTNAFHQLLPKHIQIIEQAINAVGITKYKQTLLNELSDGLFQKTMIARALAQQTPIMLLDEPSAFLDFASKHELFLMLKNFSSQQNKCIVVSSHDLDLILKYCNKVLIVHDGSAELMDTESAQLNKKFKKIGGGFI